MPLATHELGSLQDQRRMTLREFLVYDDGTENRYELLDGVLVEMGAESTINNWIIIFLIETFLSLGVGRRRIGIKQYIEVPSRWVTARDPDLMIHSEESVQAIAGRSQACLERSDPNPLLVIEVASPGAESSTNYQRDYQQKPKDYATRGIPEYWIIDPERAWVKIGTLTEEQYEFVTFQGDMPIVSPTFPKLELTAAIVLDA